MSVCWFHIHLLAIFTPWSFFSMIITLHTSLYLGKSSSFTFSFIFSDKSRTKSLLRIWLYWSSPGWFSITFFMTSSTFCGEKCWPSAGSSLYVFSHFGVSFGDLLAALCFASLCHALVAATIRKKFIPVFGGARETDFWDFVSLDDGFLLLFGTASPLLIEAFF